MLYESGEGDTLGKVIADTLEPESKNREQAV
jgi:hypothetical protein